MQKLQLVDHAQKDLQIFFYPCRFAVSDSPNVHYQVYYWFVSLDFNLEKLNFGCGSNHKLHLVFINVLISLIHQM